MPMILLPSLYADVAAAAAAAAAFLLVVARSPTHALLLPLLLLRLYHCLSRTWRQTLTSIRTPIPQNLLD